MADTWDEYVKKYLQAPGGRNPTSAYQVAQDPAWLQAQQTLAAQQAAAVAPSPSGANRFDGGPANWDLYNNSGPPAGQLPLPTPLTTEELQTRLNQLGAGLQVDNISGPATQAALQQYGMDQYGNVMPTPGSPEQMVQDYGQLSTGTIADPRITGPSAPPVDFSTPNLSFGGGGSSGPDLSALAAALQGSQGGSSSILDDLMSQLGPAPELPKFDVNKEAQNQINLKYQPQEDAIDQAMKSLSANYAQQIAAQQGYGTNADTALQKIFDALGVNLQGGQQKTADIYSQAQNASGSSYDQASQRLQQLAQGIVGQLQQSAGDLGIQQGLPAPLARILGNYQNMAGNTIQNKAISSGGLTTDMANQLAAGQARIGSSQRQGATARSDVARSVQSALSQLGLAQTQGQGQLINQKLSLEKQKPLDLQEAVQALNKSQYDMQRQAQQDRLSQITGLGNLDIQQQKVTNDQINAQNQLQISLANLAQRQSENASSNAIRAAELQASHALDGLKAAQMEAQIGLTQANTDLSQGRLDKLYNPTPTAGKVNPGALEDFLNSAQPGLWGSGASSPEFQTTVNGIINTSLNNSKDTLGQNYGGDPYLLSLDALNDPTQAPGNFDPNALRKALSLYFTGR